MHTHFGSQPSDLIAVLSPCIRPPAYEVDFAASIEKQADQAGILPENFHDTKTCTSQTLDRHYSYRMEKGQTGRMLALLSI